MKVTVYKPNFKIIVIVIDNHTGFKTSTGQVEALTISSAGTYRLKCKSIGARRPLHGDHFMQTRQDGG